MNTIDFSKAYQVLSEINKFAYEYLGWIVVISDNSIFLLDEENKFVWTKQLYDTLCKNHKEGQITNHSLIFYRQDYNSDAEIISNICKILLNEASIKLKEIHFYDDEEIKRLSGIIAKYIINE